MEGAVRMNTDSMKNISAHPADSTQSTPTVRRSSRFNHSKSISRSADMLHLRDGSEEEIRLTRAQAEKQRKEIEIELRRTVGQQIRAEFEEEIRKREEEAAREQGLERAEEKLLSWWDDYLNVHRVAGFERLVRTELEESYDVNTVYRKNKDIGNVNRESRGIININSVYMTSTENQVVNNVQKENEQIQCKYQSVELEEAYIADQVRKWGVTFDGRKGLLNFIEQVEELSLMHSIRDKKIIQCIPVLLKDEALLWYRNNKRDWKTWEEFSADLKLFYLPSRVSIQLEEEISRRTQGPKESARDYILSLQTLMRRHGEMSDIAKQERLYHNLRPEYKKYIKRTEFDSISGLIKLCDDYDQLVKQEASYKPPKQHSVMSVTMSKSNQGKKNHEATDPIVINGFDHHQSCWRCGMKGHIQRGCRNQRALMCIFCGIKGRDTRHCNCTHPKKKRYQPKSHNPEVHPEGVVKKRKRKNRISERYLEEDDDGVMWQIIVRGGRKRSRPAPYKTRPSTRNTRPRDDSRNTDSREFFF